MTTTETSSNTARTTFVLTPAPRRSPDTCSLGKRVRAIVSGSVDRGLTPCSGMAAYFASDGENHARNVDSVFTLQVVHFQSLLVHHAETTEIGRQFIQVAARAGLGQCHNSSRTTSLGWTTSQIDMPKRDDPVGATASPLFARAVVLSPETFGSLATQAGPSLM